MTAQVDSLQDIVNTVRDAVLAAFNPTDAVMVPTGGGSATCRIVAGDAVPMQMWDAHAQGSDCKEPFLWVRVMRRFRSKQFPAAIIATDCATQPVVELEIGVGRCSALSAEVDWDELDDEALVSLDDCWRVELALCRAQTLLTTAGRTVGTGAITPYGPEGGVVAWNGTLLVSL